MGLIYIDDTAVPLIHGGGGGGGGCFEASTLINCITYSKPISEIKVGDTVAAFDEIGSLVNSKVIETFYHETDNIYKVIHETGVLNITLNHWVLDTHGKYKELKDFEIGEELITVNNARSKILSVEFLRTGEVYNFKVSHYHTYVADGIKVHNGGGGGKNSSGGGSSTEDPNSLFSTDILFLTLGLGEGPVYRINPNGPQDFEVNEGNIEDLLIDGNIDHEKFYTVSNTGSIAQQRLPVFGDFTLVPQRLSSAVELKKGNIAGIPRSAITQQNTSAQPLTAIKFYFIIGGLQSQTSNGDIHGESISVSATVYNSLGESIIATQSRTITGKTNIAYSFDLYVAIPAESVSNSGYRFTIEKTDDDSNSSKIQKNITFQGWTEIIEEDIAYTRTATLGIALKAFAEHKSSMPVMTSIVKGLIVKVPSNYNQPILEKGDIDWRQVEVSDSDIASYGYYQQRSGPTSVQTTTNPIIYNGLWDGQFVYSWTQNPAWIIYDLLTNSSTGLGIPEGNIDKYSFYSAAVYCDACDENTGAFKGVSAQADGSYRYKPRTTKTSVSEVLTGLAVGTSIKERRFILDVAINEQKQVVDIINILTLTFRSILFNVGGKITLLIDKPDDLPTAIFNESNIIKDSISISGISEDALITGVDITYTDVINHYRREVLRIDDANALADRNYIENVAKLDLEGVTRKSQAIRTAQYIIADSKYSRRKISFKTGIEASDITPGSLISVAQHAASVSWGYGGIINNTSVNSNTSIYLEHLGVPSLTSSFFTANTKPLVIRVASTRSGLVDTYLLSNTSYALSNTANVLTGSEIIRVETISKYNHLTRSFSAFSGDWGDSHLPQRYDLWTLGEINDVTNIYSSLNDKIFKVISINRTSAEEVTIEGKEYISNVYSDSDSTINYDPLLLPDLFSPLVPPPAPNLYAISVPKRDLDGSIYTDIEFGVSSDLTGYTKEISTEFFHARPFDLQMTLNVTPSADTNMYTFKVDNLSQLSNSSSITVFGKNGFSTDIGRSKLLVTSVSIVDQVPVFKPNGNIQFVVQGFNGLIDKNFGTDIHVLEVNDGAHIDFGGLRGVDKITIPINQKEEGGSGDASGLLGFVGSDTRLQNYSANVVGFTKATNLLKIDNDVSGAITLATLLPDPPFYITISQILDSRYFSNNIMYVTGSTMEIHRSNTITINNIVNTSQFKQPIGVSVRRSEFVDVLLNGRTHTDYTTETGLDGLANSQVIINLSTLPTVYNNIDVTIRANVYTVPAIELNDKITWSVGNTYAVVNVSYDTTNASFNAYLTANNIYRITIDDTIKSNISTAVAVNISPNPIGIINNVNLSTKTFTFEFPSETYQGKLNLGNNKIYSINSPVSPFEPVSYGESTTRLLSRAERGIHTFKARNINKYGRKSPFVTTITTVRNIPMQGVTDLLITEELYKDSTLGVAIRVIASFTAITGQDVLDYEISYKITGTNEGDLTSFNTVKVSSAGIDSDGKIRFKIDNIEKGLSSNPNSIIVRVTPLNKDIRGSTVTIEQDIVGKTESPQNVTSFAAGQTNDSLVFAWQYVLNENTGDNIDIDLFEVHIRRLSGAVDTSQSNLLDLWPRSDPIAVIDARTNKVIVSIDQYGEYTYLVRTKDTSGNFSETIGSSLFTSIAQFYTKTFKPYSEDDPSDPWVSTIVNSNSTEYNFPSFANSNTGGIAYNYTHAVDNANGSSSGWSVVSGSPTDLRALANAVYTTQIRDIGNVLIAAIQIEIGGDQALTAGWLDYAETIGTDQVAESQPGGGEYLRDIDFSGSLGIGNILGFSNVGAATVTWDYENNTLVSGVQGSYDANVFGIVVLGNFVGDTSNANVLCLINSVSNANTIRLGQSWYANGKGITGNGYANLAVAGTAFRLVNLKQWLDLSDSSTFYGTTGLVRTNVDVRYSTTSPFYANGNVNVSVFTTNANSDGFAPFVTGARLFRYFQLRYSVYNSDPVQAELILDRFKYQVTLEEKTFSQSVVVNSANYLVDYSRMEFTQIPKVTGAIVTSSSNQLAQPQVIVLNRGLTDANIAVYFSNGLSAHNIGSAPEVDFTVTGV